MMHLDLPTLAVASTLISIGIAVGFSFILALLPRQRVLQWWAASLWLVALAVFGLSLGQILGSLHWVLLGDLAAVAATGLLIHGVALHTGGGSRLGRLLGWLGLYAAVVGWFSLVQPSALIRQWLFTLLSVGSDLWVVQLLLRCPQRDIRRSCRLAAGAFGFHATLYIVRQLGAMQGMAGGLSLLQDISPMMSLYMILLLLILAKCFALLLLIVERLMAELQRMAQRDGLTGLLNHNAVLADGARALQQSRRRQQALSVLLCDLDHFKTINDTWGHQAGDQVLIQVAALIRQVLEGHRHLASRYGGEEFLLVLPGCDGPKALVLAEQLRTAISQAELPWSGPPWHISLSIGISEADPDSSLGHLVARADQALYDSKRAGRNRVTLQQAPVAELGMTCAGG